MELKGYDLTKAFDKYVYEFYSEGPRGKIKKHVQFQPMRNMSGNVFNLSFGDVNDITGRIDDMAKSNNNDRLIVLSTVAAAVLDFTNVKPNAIILIRGSTLSRTRLYQMGICVNLMEINENFEIKGFIGETWELFERNRNYEGFLITRKKS